MTVITSARPSTVAAATTTTAAKATTVTPTQAKPAASSFAPGVQGVASQTASASSVDPMEVLKRVQNGDVTFSLPLEPGKLGPVKVKDGTVVTFHATVKDGKLDMGSVKADFKPDLDGPAWADVRGAKVKDGRLTLDVRGFPDPSIGPKLPEKFSDLVSTMQGLAKNPSGDVSFFGMKVAQVDKQGAHFKPSGIGGWLAAGAAGAVGVAALGADKLFTHDVNGPKVDGNPAVLAGLKVDLRGVELSPGPLSIGPAGTVNLGAGSRFDIHGGLTDLRMTGHANLNQVAIDSQGVTLRGSAGSGDLDLHYTRPGNGSSGTVSADLSHLNLDTQYAVTRRANGDYVELGDGHLRDGSVKLTESVAFGDGMKVTGVKHHLDSLTIQSFDGTVNGGQLTFKDAKDTATVVLGRSHLNGHLEVTPGELSLRGTIDGQATVKDFQAGKGVGAVDVKSAQLRGAGALSYDSGGPFSLRNGNLDVDAELNGASVKGKAPVVGSVGASAGQGTTVSAELRGVDFSSDKGLTGIVGVGVQVDGKNLGVQAGKVSVNGNVKVGGTLGQVDPYDQELARFQQELREAGQLEPGGALSGMSPFVTQLYQQQFLIGLLAQAGLLGLNLFRPQIFG
ncbi:MAG: hypothetical protein K1X89_26585 [Myxococcaceae bacterium]|nr:hypothetical protein [Myxococcaceae bacterium]